MGLIRGFGVWAQKASLWQCSTASCRGRPACVRSSPVWASHAVRLYHLGAKPVRRSTLSEANTKRPVAVFSERLSAMMRQAHRGLRRKLAETTYLIDATGVRLNEHSAGWARFSAGVCGAKGHVIADADRPI